MPTMRAVDINYPDSDSSLIAASALYIKTDKFKPELYNDEVLVRVKAFGINRIDLLQRQGLVEIGNHAIGVEFSGVIDSIGRKADTELKVGDEVIGLAQYGAYAEFVSAAPRLLVSKPAGMDHWKAAAIPQAWIAATQARSLINDFCKKEREKKREDPVCVLWHAGTSAVSLAGIQLTAGLASIVLGTVRHDEKKKFLEQTLGVSRVYNSETEDWVRQVKDDTMGRGADVIVDLIGGPMLDKNLEALAIGGQLICLGALGGTEVPAGTHLGKLSKKRARVEGVRSVLEDRWSTAFQTDLMYQFKYGTLPFTQENRVGVFIEKVLPWEQIVEATELVESNNTKGKVVCTID